MLSLVTSGFTVGTASGRSSSRIVTFAFTGSVLLRSASLVGLVSWTMKVSLGSSLLSSRIGSGRVLLASLAAKESSCVVPAKSLPAVAEPAVN